MLSCCQQAPSHSRRPCHPLPRCVCHGTVVLQVFYGLRYILENYVYRRWTLQVRLLLLCSTSTAAAVLLVTCEV